LRIDEFELPSRVSQWLISLELSALTVAGPCRIFTGFPIAPTVAVYKLDHLASQGVIAAGKVGRDCFSRAGARITEEKWKI
jgi:hypothetical protein